MLQPSVTLKSVLTLCQTDNLAFNGIKLNESLHIKLNKMPFNYIIDKAF